VWAEEEIGYQLPTRFVELLKKQNGGYIRYSLPEMVHDSITGIGPHFPSLTGFDLEDGQEYVSFPLRGLVPFDGDGHWFICLDYRRNATTPSVTCVDIECDRESGIADSFPDYLSKLRIDARDEYVLEKVADIETVKSQLSKALAAGFDPPDVWAHGYPVHRAALGSESSPEWLWISPNTVPRGFVRPDDPRYVELKDLLPGEAARYPELPANSYIFIVTDTALPRVINACRESHLSVRPLHDYVKDS
jgi:SMI1 / KNR4 family (SUKH-1)